MPGVDTPPCYRCNHPYSVHGLDGAPCRVTNCGCIGVVEPPDEPEEPAADPKRLVIEIPDGFAVTVQLMPLETAE